MVGQKEGENPGMPGLYASGLACACMCACIRNYIFDSAELHLTCLTSNFIAPCGNIFSFREASHADPDGGSLCMCL